MDLENCNAHGDENTRPNSPQNENDPSGNKKWYRQASQRLVCACVFFHINICVIYYNLYLYVEKWTLLGQTYRDIYFKYLKSTHTHTY